MGNKHILDDIIMDEARRRAEYGIADHVIIARLVAYRCCIPLTHQYKAPAWLLKKVDTILEKEF